MAVGERINILFVEDSEADLDLTIASLREAGLDLEYERVDSEVTLRDALARRPWDLVISDFAMPGFNGLHALDIVLAAGLDLPFIFVSGVLGEERAVAAMRAGARDYVLKDNLARLGPAVRREVIESKNRSRRAIAEEALRVEQLRYRKIFDSAAIGLLVVDASALKSLDGAPPRAEAIDVRDANDEARRLLELEGSDVVLGQLAPILRPGAQVHTEITASIAGHLRRYMVSGRVPSIDDDWSFLVISILDVTERWRLEQSLSKAQRMEALGRLAGGVAHDFNNLLTVISSTARFIGESVPPASPVAEDVGMVLDASQRAAGLTRQLLAFSRDEPYRPVVVDPNEAIQRVHRMLSRIIEAHIDFGLVFGSDVASVLIDPLQFDQIILNLVMNARDAMPSGGTLRIVTSMEQPPNPADDGAAYVCIRVTDTGHGMDAATRAHIFEPFFTSKPPGLGTGLGLAIVFGVVSRHDGQLDVESTVGAGSTFAVYLPVYRGLAETVTSVAPEKLGGEETVLIVEDHDLVRRTAQRILEQAGYHVLAAASGGAALSSLASSGRRVDLVISDLVMPGMNGLELRRAVLERHPQVRFLLTSAYGGAALTSTPLPESLEFLPKPFSAHELLSKVRAVLDARSKQS
jgi:signal transduction histidine kinase